eukprot:SAG22_NODE_12542_length_438_cov_1.294985_1_plen_46_part_01
MALRTYRLTTKKHVVSTLAEAVVQIRFLRLLLSAPVPVEALVQALV